VVEEAEKGKAEGANEEEARVAEDKVELATPCSRWPAAAAASPASAEYRYALSGGPTAHQVVIVWLQRNQMIAIARAPSTDGSMEGSGRHVMLRQWFATLNTPTQLASCPKYRALFTSSSV
jgi:hypothetical protein